MKGLPERLSDECRRARQNNSYLGALTRFCIDLNCARVLLHDDIVTDRKAKTGAFSRRLGREERLEHLFFYVRHDADAVIANTDLHTIAKVSGRGRESRRVASTIGLRSALGRRIKAVCNQIKKSPSDILWEKHLHHRQTDRRLA